MSFGHHITFHLAHWVNISIGKILYDQSKTISKLFVTFCHVQNHLSAFVPTFKHTTSV